MKIKLPVQVKEIENGKLIRKRDSIEFDVDVSLASQMRYEKKFPELAQNEDLLNYSRRIREHEGISLAKILSELKLFYCWLDTQVEFDDFLKLIDLTDKEYVKEFTKAISESFDIILNGSAEKN